MYIGIVARKREGVEDSADAINQVINVVCEHFRLSQEQIIEQSRRRKIVEARQIAIYLLCQKKVSQPCIAKYFGKDRTTIIHSRDVVKDMMKVDSEFFIKVQQIGYSANFVVNKTNF